MKLGVEWNPVIAIGHEQLRNGQQRFAILQIESRTCVGFSASGFGIMVADFYIYGGYGTCIDYHIWDGKTRDQLVKMGKPWRWQATHQTLANIIPWITPLSDDITPTCSSLRAPRRSVQFKSTRSGEWTFSKFRTVPEQLTKHETENMIGSRISRRHKGFPSSF